ncbi:MAG: FAD-dependent oxidoreductase [Lentisphaeria bacterium]|nr:FAD-dependent oxidoreductase [Lentisphaeria bacterium]
MDYDVIVAGGGPAGVGAAYMAAGCGAKTLLLERGGRLGGTAVQSVVGPLMGQVDSLVTEQVLERIGGHCVDFRRVDIELYDLLAERGADILLHAPVSGVLLDGGRVAGVEAECREGRRAFRARCVIDCTGDGEIAFRAGVPFEIGRGGDGLMQPVSIMYLIAGIDPARRMKCDSEQEARIVTVSGRTWEEIVLEAQAAGRLPETVSVIRLYPAVREDENIVNATQVNYIDGTSSRDLTRAEIEGRRQAFRILDFLRETVPGYENAFISQMPAAIGVRETRRFEGVARLEKSDCIAGRRFEDAVVRRACFSIDIHNPNGGGQAAGHEENAVGTAERARPYDIRYGALVPRRVDGLLFAGRCISASHEALASCRVMCIAMALGGGAGAAAAYAAGHHCELRDVPVRGLQPLLFRQ